MFKLQPNPKFWAKIEYTLPGESRAQSFEVEFKHLGKEGLARYFESIAGKADAEALSELITNWRGVDAEFSVEVLGEMLNNYPGIGMALYDTYRRELMDGRRKN